MASSSSSSSNSNATDTSSLKVVLFCSGNGADVGSYRPRRDDSQWWNRRDALVRCVASFLFGPSAAMTGRQQQQQQQRELVLFYDGDHCRVHMSLEGDDDDDSNNNNGTSNGIVIPSEHVIIALWKEAVGKAIQYAAKPKPQSAPNQPQPLTVARKGKLRCWAVLSSCPPTELSADGSSSSKHGPSFPKIQDWTKLQLLEYLQQEGSIDFLREHGLNSNPTVILRKTNRGALTKVYHQWVKMTSKLTTKPESSHRNNNKGNNHQPQSPQKLLQTIFEELLAPIKHKNLIAATL